MPRLRRVSAEVPGIARRRHGRGFSYRYPDGRTVRDPAVLARIRSLAIPPAWTDVWICPDPDGHLQATGTDAAGRRQYRYHDRWRQRRDAQKFDRMLGFAQSLPSIRRGIESDLALDGMPRDRVLACAARLLDLACFRIGSEAYARANGSFGLSTLRREHVRVSDDTVRFDFIGKSGQRRTHEVRDPDVLDVISTLKRRRDGSRDLLAYRQEGTWQAVSAADVNGYVRGLGGDGYSAKDFRTWQGTVVAAVALAAEEPAASATVRRKQVAAAMREVGAFLGNTPAVARASYVDPRLLDRFEEGRTIPRPLVADKDADDPRWRDEVERAVLDLLTEDQALAEAA